MTTLMGQETRRRNLARHQAQTNFLHALLPVRVSMEAVVCVCMCMCVCGWVWRRGDVACDLAARMAWRTSCSLDGTSARTSNSFNLATALGTRSSELPIASATCVQRSDAQRGAKWKWWEGSGGGTSIGAEVGDSEGVAIAVRAEGAGLTNSILATPRPKKGGGGTFAEREPGSGWGVSEPCAGDWYAT